jgi:signal transduction histidine kinase
LLEVQRALSSRLDLDTVMRRIAEEARLLIGASFGSVSIHEGDQLCIKALAGDYGPGMFVGYTMPAHTSASGLAMISGKVVRVDSLNDPRVHRDAMEQARIQSLLAVPLLSGDTALGVISVGHYSPAAFDENDAHVLLMLAPGAVIALENARLYAQAQQVAVLEERQRLARDLHDAVTQTLFSAGLIADVLPRIWQRRPDEAERRLAELRQLTRGALAEMRTLLLELRPDALIEARLGDVLRQLGEAITGRTRLPVTVTVVGDCALPPDVQIALYRIAQEALNNVLRHAHAGQVQIDLSLTEDRVRLWVHDDGQGFAPMPVEAGHFGLRNMQERARNIGASFSINSRPGEGTEVLVLWQASEEDCNE